MSNQKRWKIDLECGYIIVSSKEDAARIYEERDDALRLVELANFMDFGGRVIAGLPIFDDLTLEPWRCR